MSTDLLKTIEQLRRALAEQEQLNEDLAQENADLRAKNARKDKLLARALTAVTEAWRILEGLRK